MTQVPNSETPEVAPKAPQKKPKAAPKAAPQVAPNPASQRHAPVKKEKLSWGGILETY